MINIIRGVGKWLIEIDKQLTADNELRVGLVSILVIAFVVTLSLMLWKATPKGIK